MAMYCFSHCFLYSRTECIMKYGAVRKFPRNVVLFVSSLKWCVSSSSERASHFFLTWMASKMIKDMLRFQTVKDVNDAMQMKLFQTWKYPLLSLCHFVDEWCLYSNKLSTFGPCETHCFFTRDWHCGLLFLFLYPFQVSFIFRAFILTHWLSTDIPTYLLFSVGWLGAQQSKKV